MSKNTNKIDEKRLKRVKNLSKTSAIKTTRINHIIWAKDGHLAVKDLENQKEDIVKKIQKSKDYLEKNKLFFELDKLNENILAEKSTIELSKKRLGVIEKEGEEYDRNNR